MKAAFLLLLASASPALAQVHDHGHAGHDMPATPPELQPRASSDGQNEANSTDNAADAVFGEDAMRASRDALSREHGDVDYAIMHFDMLEARVDKGSDGIFWDATLSFGGDIDRIEIKSAGEGGFGRGVDYSDNQLLWSHAISPWYDLKLGGRLDLGAGPDRAHAAAGLAGTAPYNIEAEAMAFLSEKGDLTGHIKAEHDIQITQRLIARPLVQFDLAGQDIPELGIGRGLLSVTTALRLRYEVMPELAPYIGVEWSRALGRTARYVRAEGDDPESAVFVAGLRFWF